MAPDFCRLRRSSRDKRYFNCARVAARLPGPGWPEKPLWPTLEFFSSVCKRTIPGKQPSPLNPDPAAARSKRMKTWSAKMIPGDITLPTLEFFSNAGKTFCKKFLLYAAFYTTGWIQKGHEGILLQVFRSLFKVHNV